MQILRDPLFLGVEFQNIHTKDKGTPSISVRVNLQRDDLIYVQSVKSRMEVKGYVHPETGLFITETEEMEPGSIYHRFRLEAVKFARTELTRFLERLSKLDADTYASRGYRNFNELSNQLKNCLVDRQGLYADLQKQVNLVTSRKFPKINEFLVFSDDADIPYPVTAKLPYPNPANRTLTEEERRLVTQFLDVFFDEYNRFAFAWYLGAALSNIPLYDDRISKLAVVSSSHGGSGKSTLVLSMVNALFTQHYRDIKDDFDSFFTLNNRFGTSTLSTKRMCVYSEASFNADPLSEDHNFAGINVSAIKSMVTEGYLSAEIKFGDRSMERLSGFHLVLTNHPPMVTSEDQAMNRRILPIMLRPTSMAQKARTLHLWGRQKLDQYVADHAELFAAYFVSVFRSDEYAFSETDYDHKDYIREIRDSQEDLDEEERASRKELDVLKTDGLLKFVEGLERQMHLNLDLLKTDIVNGANGSASEALAPHIKLDSKNARLYIDSSKSFFLRYGSAGAKVRDAFKEFYGAPEKKYHKRMFVVPFAK